MTETLSNNLFGSFRQFVFLNVTTTIQPLDYFTTSSISLTMFVENNVIIVYNKTYVNEHIDRITKVSDAQ